MDKAGQWRGSLQKVVSKMSNILKRSHCAVQHFCQAQACATKNKFLISLEVLLFYEQVQVSCSYIHNKGIHIHLTMFNQYFAFNVWFAVL